MKIIDEDLAISDWDEEKVTEYRNKIRKLRNINLYIKVQNVIKNAKIKKYANESKAISSEGITFWGAFSGKNSLQLEKMRNIKLKMELLQAQKIETKEDYEEKDMMADLYACAVSEFGGNFTKEMKKIYNTVKRNCYEEKITDEQIQGLAREKITSEQQSYLPILHQEKTKGFFGETKNQIEFYKIENKKLENQIVLERGKSQFSTFNYIGKNAGIIIPVNIQTKH